MRNREVMRRSGALRLLSLVPAVLVSAVGSVPARAGEIPLAGRTVTLRAGAATPLLGNLTASAVDAALAAPLPDPTPRSSLIVSVARPGGSCRVELLLDPALWRPAGAKPADRGWRYRDRSGAPGSVRSVLLRPGRLVVRTGPLPFSCTPAAPDATAVSVELRAGGTRLCALFDAELRLRGGRLLRGRSSGRAACPDADITLANLNVLHGLFCPDGDNCRRPDRMELLARHVEARGCPDLLTFQEVVDLPGHSSVAEIEDAIEARCPGAYRAVLLPHAGVDEQLVLSRHPVVESELLPLFGVIPIRSVTFVRVDHPAGPVDVFTTHLASGSDAGSSPCGASCPAACVAAGAATVRDCQTVQLADFVAARHDVPGPALVTGDFNAPPGSFPYQHMLARGFVDTTRAAGNPECDPVTGLGCTSGRADEDLSDLESPARGVDIRIDYIFLLPPGPGSVCSAALDPPGDSDGDGIATRLFADEPNPFAPACGPAPLPPCWPSDHVGTEVDLACH